MEGETSWERLTARMLFCEQPPKEQEETLK